MEQIYKNYKISVIIPVYNVEAYLRKCIDSVCNQTYQNLEIILVDDGSTDTSGQICDEYSLKDDRIIVYHINNSGPGIARNYGIEKSHGDYIAFVDSDDWIEPEMYKTLIEISEKEDLPIVGCSVMTEYEDGTSKNNYANRSSGNISGERCILDILYQTENAWGAMYNKIYRKEVFNTIRFPEISNMEDYVVSTQIFLNREKIYFYNVPMYHYIFRTGSLSKKTDFSENDILLFKISDNIRERLKNSNAKNEILVAADSFTFRMYASVFWKMQKTKYIERKKIKKQYRKDALYVFKRYMQNAQKQKGDFKRIIQFLIAII